MADDVVETVPAVLRRAAAEHGDIEALVDGAARITYRTLLPEVERVAAALLSRGLRPGDRVAVWASNSARWALAALACFHVGLTLVPVSTRYRGGEAHDLLARGRVRALFVEDRDLLGMLRAEPPLPGLETVVTVAGAAPDALTWEQLLADAAPGDPVTVTPDTVLQIMFTSGTTGRPKGVPHTHGQVVRLYDRYSRGLGLRAGDRYLLVNPFFHSFGLLAGVLSCVLRGATALPVRRFDPAAALELVERERVTGIPGPPTLYATLMNDPTRPARDLSSLRLAVTGASVIPSELVRRMRTDLGFTDVLTAYGLTEATGAVTMCRIGDPDEVVEATSGRAIDGVEVAVGPTGEILVRGFNVMSGYVDDPAATAAAVDPDGWLHTGDVGSLDAAGNLTITDRIGDMFIVGGFNAYPAEIEQLLTRHPAVSEAAVVGVPDDRLGEVGRAFVVARRGCDPTEAELIGWCRDRLAGFKVPRTVRFLPELPRTASGKVAKAGLRGPVTG
jgi:HIP---CoA ligase